MPVHAHGCRGVPAQSCAAHAQLGSRGCAFACVRFLRVLLRFALRRTACMPASQSPRQLHAWRGGRLNRLKPQAAAPHTQAPLLLECFDQSLPCLIQAIWASVGCRLCTRPGSLLCSGRPITRVIGAQVYTAMIDEVVDERGYIVPGLGDAGDRAYGTPH